VTARQPWQLTCPQWPRGPLRAYDLAQPLAHGMPRHPNVPAYLFSLQKLHGDSVTGSGLSSASEVIVLGGHVGTHIDSLGHVSRDGRIHGGAEISGRQSFTGGIEIGSVADLPPLVADGHLVDAPRILGRLPEPGEGLGASLFEEAFGDTAPEPGSVVLVRTGWAGLWSDHRRYLGLRDGLPGVTLDGARWLSAAGIAATGSDTVAYERSPDPDLPVHEHLLVDHGIPIMEGLNLEVLASDGVARFLFVAVALPITGGTGSPIRPIALAGMAASDQGDQLPHGSEEA
jgi:kynurenine formamidase